MAIYAWAPLPILEICSSAHLEAFFLLPVTVGLFLLDGTRNAFRGYAGVVSLALAVCIKQVALLPLVLAGRVWVSSGRNRWRRVLVSVFTCLFVWLLFYLPFLSDRGLFVGLQTYAEHWRFNGLLFLSLEFLFSCIPLNLADLSAKTFGFLAAGSLISWRMIRGEDLFQTIVFGFLVILLFSPVVYPWYALWFFPYIVLLPIGNLFIFGIVFSQSLLYSYEVLGHPDNWNLSIPIMLLQLGIPTLGLFLYIVLKKSGFLMPD